MEQKRKSKIILIVIILLVILILLTGFAYAYFSTDTFKSNKELFFKYMIGMADENEGLIDPKIKEYFEKKTNTPYQNDGTITFNIATENGTSSSNNSIDDFNISFSGQTDKVNDYITQDISLNYSEDVAFPISYRKVGDMVGLQTKYVGSKYVAINMGELEEQTYEGTEELYEFSNGLEKLKKLMQLPFNEQELKQLQETYMNVLKTSLQDSQFTKVEENNQKGYKLTLNGEQLQNIMIQLLETLKNDQTTLDKLNEYIKEQKNSAKITANTIENIIKNIKNNTNSNTENYEIIVYQEKGKMTKLAFIIEEVKLQLEKKMTEDSLQYIISIETTDNDKEIRITANYEGIETMQNVNENYELEIKLGEQGILQQAQAAKNQNNLAEEKEAIELLVLEAKANNYMNNNTTITAEDLEEVKQEDTIGGYEKIEIEQNNDDTIQLTFIDTNDEFVIDDTGKIIEKPEETNTSFNTTDSQISYQYQYNNQINFTNTVTVEEFSDENAMILNDYEEEQVNNFLQQVAERIELVNSNQMEELGLEEDENPFGQMLTSIFGMYLYNQSAITIGGTSNSIAELEVNTFNAKFENYESTNLQGVTVKGLLSTIQLNNESQEEDRQIKEIHFDGEEFEGTEQNISYIKSCIETENYYRVEFERDEDTGLIYRAVINEK